MNGNQKDLFIVAGFLAMVLSGCAKTDVVKKDGQLTDIVAASASVEPTAQQLQARTTAAGNVTSEKEVAPETRLTESVSAQVASSDTLNLVSIYFDFDSVNLSEKSREYLTRNFEVLRKNGKYTVRVEGNCDERGSDEYNLALSDKRAKVAVQYLITLGIPSERLTSVSYGKEKPAVSDHDEAGWAKNRRDDFVLLP